jgi:DNA sulfur modification protein DndD
MTFDHLVLHNFSLYRGRQELVLTPKPGKPIILIGGLNGTGKTTILDALQLALYGKLARCSNRGALPYEQYLQETINRHVDIAEGAAIEVQFRHVSAGIEHTYRVHRSWSVRAKGLRERIEVVVDGKLDPILTQSWTEHVEEFIPARISHLFFFDGEKIESLADFESSAKLLTTAVHSVLGLDLVDRLASDLSILERRKRLDLKSSEDRHEIERLQHDLKRLEQEYDQMLFARGAEQNAFDFEQKQLRELEIRLEREGGKAYDNRSTLDSKRRSALHELQNVETELADLAQGPAPLLLVGELLARAAKQDKFEQEAIQSNTISEIIAGRDEQIIRKLRSLHVANDKIDALKQFLTEDRGRRKHHTRQTGYLGLDAETRNSLHLLRGSQLPDMQSRIRRLLDRASSLSNDLVNVERAIEGIPAEDVIFALLDERKTTERKIAEIRARLALLNSELDKKKREREQVQSRLVKKLEHSVAENFEQEDIGRIISYSTKVKSTLQAFRAAVVRKDVTTIERLVFDSFRHLLRKNELVSELRIDPESFTVTVKNGDGNKLSADRLSAGERQLLAVSLLWGLARTSGRPLPVVTDTPLGRLDSMHRDHLVERYFPHASHQMILLSTDEEIDERYYQRLKPSIAHSYHLEFDERLGTTQAERGYFWEAAR